MQNVRLDYKDASQGRGQERCGREQGRLAEPQRQGYCQPVGNWPDSAAKYQKYCWLWHCLKYFFASLHVTHTPWGGYRVTVWALRGAASDVGCPQVCRPHFGTGKQFYLGSVPTPLFSLKQFSYVTLRFYFWIQVLFYPYHNTGVHTCVCLYSSPAYIKHEWSEERVEQLD